MKKPIKPWVRGWEGYGVWLGFDPYLKTVDTHDPEKTSGLPIPVSRLTPLTSQPQTIRSQAVLTPQPPTMLGTPKLYPSTEGNYLFHSESVPAPPKTTPASQQLLLGTTHLGPTTTQCSLTPRHHRYGPLCVPQRQHGRSWRPRSRNLRSSSTSARRKTCDPPCTASSLDRKSREPCPQAQLPTCGFTNTPSAMLTRVSEPRGSSTHSRWGTGFPWRSLPLSWTRPTPLPSSSTPLVDVGVHSNKRVMSPASRVVNHGSMVWLWTGVSSGNRPMFGTKMQKILLALWRVPAWTEYLEECHSGAVTGIQSRRLQASSLATDWSKFWEPAHVLERKQKMPCVPRGLASVCMSGKFCLSGRVGKSRLP